MKQGGLYDLGLIAEFLGQRPADMKERVELDGLPVIQVPCATRPKMKVALIALASWLAERSSGRALTVDELERELERCRAAMAARRHSKAARRKKETV